MASATAVDTAGSLICSASESEIVARPALDQAMTWKSAEKLAAVSGPQEIALFCESSSGWQEAVTELQAVLLHIVVPPVFA